MKGKAEREAGARLRELASRTLEAYRKLNEAAAQSAASGDPTEDAVSHAGEVLQDVLGTLRGKAASAN